MAKNEDKWMTFKVYGLEFMDNQKRWYYNYEALKAHVLETGHFPNKHDKRLNWAKFQMKKIKARTLDPERQRLFEELMAMRSGQHTGGRRKAEVKV